MEKSPWDVEEGVLGREEGGEGGCEGDGWGKIEVPGMWQLQGYGRGPQ